MALQCEELEYCRVKTSYTADAEVVNEKYEDIISQIYDSKIKIPGFRQGKATKLAIKLRCKKQIEKLLKQELLNTAYADIVFETKMKPIGSPQVIKSELLDSSFFCEMVWLIKPTFELKEYKHFKIPQPQLNVSANDLTEQMIQSLRMAHGDVTPYEEHDMVQQGDQVTIDIDCKINGEQFKDFTNAGAMYKVGENTIPDFDSHIIGMKAGEMRDFDIIFVGDNIPDHLLNKRAKFNVTLHMGTKHHPHPLNDELAEKAGCKNFNELRQKAYGSASVKLKTAAEQHIIQQILARLVQNHDFEIPSWLLLIESQRLAAQNNLEWDKLSDEQKKEFNDDSLNAIKLSFIFDSIREVEPEANSSEQELLNYIHKLLESQGKDGKKIIEESKKDGSLYGMLARLKDEFTVQWILSTCEIVE